MHHQAAPLVALSVRTLALYTSSLGDFHCNKRLVNKHRAPLPRQGLFKYQAMVAAKKLDMVIPTAYTTFAVASH
eukprot:6460050-Amphidinium_carterae.1